MSAVAKRYALALIDTAREAGSLPEVESDLEALDALLSESEDFAEFVRNPLVPEEVQTATLKKLFGDSLQTLTSNLLQLLVLRERLPDLPGIVGQALEFARAERGVMTVEVVSAVEMADAQRDALRKKLADRTGKTIELDCRVDGALIGGFRLHMGDLVEDYSLATKLETFKQNVLNA